METRFQHLFLSIPAALLCAGLLLLPASKVEAGIDREFFDAGVFAGLLNIEDFGSEFAMGANVTFRATEDFFLQFNYLQASSALSSYEKSQGRLFSGADRDFKHYDLLVGVNLFQTEFVTFGEPNIGSLYLLGGVGDTAFGGEESFTYTWGAGYQFSFSRNYLLRLDYRDYIYKTNLIAEDKTVHNGLISAGIAYLF